MAANLCTVEINGSPPGVTTQHLGAVPNVYFQMIDAAAKDSSNQFLRPLMGVYYPYWKSLYLNALTSPPTEINQVKLSSTGSITWVGVSLQIGDQTPLRDDYVQATGTVGKTGDEMVAGHSGISSKSPITLYTSGSPKSIPGSIQNPNTGRITNLIILQMTITTELVPNSSGETIVTWKYQES